MAEETLKNHRIFAQKWFVFIPNKRKTTENTQKVGIKRKKDTKIQ